MRINNILVEAMTLSWFLMPIFLFQLFYAIRIFFAKGTSKCRNKGSLLFFLFSSIANICIGTLIGNLRVFFYSSSDGNYFQSAWELRIANEAIIATFSLFSTVLAIILHVRRASISVPGEYLKNEAEGKIT